MILLFSFIGEFFRMVIPLPVPASVYGLVLLLAALLTGVIKLDQVEGAADFLCIANACAIFVRSPFSEILTEVPL